jgi:hypothetical protein
MIIKKIFPKTLTILFLILFCVLPQHADAETMRGMESSYVTIFFEPGAAPGAEKVINIYPEIRTKTQTLFGKTYSQKPLIVLINDRERFIQMAGNPITVAYAVPSKNLIVMDYSIVSTRPFSLETTLIHEFCHLLLHEHIPNIPTWLDEGLCQWASGGLDEIIYNRRQSALNRASVSGQFIPFENLTSGFPISKTARILAYEQSKSFVTYMVREFGQEKLLDYLDRMAHGNTSHEAFHQVYPIGLEQMESTWQDSIRKDYNWFTYFSNHVHEILFVAGALLTVIAFLKLIIKKHRYKDDDFEE